MIGYVFAFTTGLLLGVLGMFGISYMVVASDRKKTDKKKEVEKLKQAEAKAQYEKVRPRIKKASDISNRQLELYAISQQPSKNGLHSKFKNDAIKEIKILEKEKRDILRSIIAEGYDPELTLTENGKNETVKLSEYMVRNKIPMTADADENQPVGPEGSRPTKSSKFFIIDGGKSDVTH